MCIIIGGEQIMKKITKVKLIIILLTPLTIILNIITRRFPGFVEKYYSTYINKYIREALNSLSGLVKFSLGEILFYILVIMLVILVIKVLISIIKRNFLKDLLNLGVFLSVLYVLFMVLWGFNYNRMSLDKIINVKIEKSSEKDLYALCEDLASKANLLKEKVQENSQGVTILPKGYKEAFIRASQGYSAASDIFPVFAGKYAHPKAIISSPKMSYTGIGGVYMPYTGEANVNVNSPEFMIPSTATHEMAHQRGFAREDEANYIAYLTCTLHPDNDFKYSGVMLALVHSINALADKNMEDYKKIASKLSPGVKRDLKYQSEFWEKYEGKVEKISNNVNDNYLKSNGQSDGVESYGRMVDLLLAEFKAKNP